MKHLIHFLFLFLILLTGFESLQAQKTNFTTNKGMTIGFGAGGAYQSSDLLNSRGGGFDFTLGSHLYKKENALLSLDWKFRFLPGINRAYDHRINADTYDNIRYNFYNYDLEFGLTLNRLRERTRIVVTGFAGAGITHGRTSTNLYDELGNLYDYSSIDPNRDRSLVYRDLLDLTDESFETFLNNRAAILPTAGFFIGYQFSRSFSMGIEHKTNFYLTERNSITGINLDNRVSTGSPMDLNHYTSLGFKWNLRGGASFGGGGNYNYYPDYTNPVTTPITTPVTPPPDPAPSVRITDPSADMYRTPSFSHTIRAEVRNTAGYGSIRFLQDEQVNSNFTFNSASGTFSANVSLREGQNRFRIEASNRSGTASDEVVIINDRPAVAVRPLPEVRFTNPPNPVSVSQKVFPMTAQTRNVNSWNDVAVLMNGIPNNHFNLSPNGEVTINLPLEEGPNAIEVRVQNDAGTATDKTTITYTRPVRIDPPVITLLDPPSTSYRTFDEVGNLRASIRNIQHPDQIDLSVDGYRIDDFGYDSYTRVLEVGILLNEGPNNISILATNEAGTDTETLTFIKETRPCPLPAIILTDPPRSQVNTERQTYPLKAEVRNVNSSSQVRLTLNGTDQSFNFNGNMLSANLSLRTGNNMVQITASNDCGKDSENLSINMAPPCLAPVVNVNVTEINQPDASHELRGTVRNMTSASGLSLSLDGSTLPNYRFNAQTGELTARIKVGPGNHGLVVSARNECGADSKTVEITVAAPCLAPVVNVNVTEINQPDASHELRGTVRNMTSASGLSLSLDGSTLPNYRFNAQTGELTARIKVGPGNHGLVVSAKNDCGTDFKTFEIKVEEPCLPPVVNISVTEVNQADASHELRGTVTNIKNKTGISLSVDGRAEEGFQFVPASGVISAKFKLQPGSHTIVVSARNECGSDSKTLNATVKEEACGPRINPGNSAWQFCLVTPSGTYTRDDLTNSGFRYSGSASSIYFMPIAGGGDARVNGSPYQVRSGQYYLFTGNLQVTVSTSNPGNMGHWSVCISSDREPQSGNGSNRPKSPCETEPGQDNDQPGKGKEKNDGGSQ